MLRRFNVTTASQNTLKRSKSNTFLKAPVSRSYFNRTGSDGIDYVIRKPDMTKHDYGLPDVRLDSQKYYSAFSDSKTFLRSSEPWMLWQPPEELIRLEEWSTKQKELREMQEERAKMDPTSASTLRKFTRRLSGAAILEALMQLVDNLNAGNLEASQTMLHLSCYNYIKGWTQYLKDQGYTCEYRILEIPFIQVYHSRFLVPQADLPSAFATTPLWDLYQHDQDRTGACSWVLIATQDSFTILDHRGAVVRSSPLSMKWHIWKCGLDNTKGIGLIYDIDNQVALRSHDIITKEKLFLDSDAPKDEVWMMANTI